MTLPPQKSFYVLPMILAGMFAGALLGLLDSYAAITHQGLEKLTPEETHSTYLLGVILHLVAGIIGGFLLTAGARIWKLLCQKRSRLIWTALALLVGLGGVVAILWSKLNALEWDAVDWRLLEWPVLFIGVSVILALLIKKFGSGPKIAFIALGIALFGVCLMEWEKRNDTQTSALVRLSEHSVTSTFLLRVSRTAFDWDNDDYPSVLCGTACDCDDTNSEIHPLAKETPGNGVDEDCNGLDDREIRTTPLIQVDPDIKLRELQPKPTQKPYSWKPRPNIVIIMVDALRADHLGCYGYDKPTTPNLDSYAKKGVVFEQARAPGNQTRFSVPPFLTGKYFSELSRTGGEWPTLMAKEVTFPEQLQSLGYRTEGIISLGYLQKRYGFNQGFEHFDASPVHARKPYRETPIGDYVTDQALKRADQLDKAKPFLMWVHYGDVHSPYLLHKNFKNFGRNRIGKYDSEVAFTDHHIDRLIRGLKKRKLMENTIVIITSDHGEGLDKKKDHGSLYHGPNLYDEVVRVPLIIFGKGIKPGRYKTPVSLIDIFPTLAEIIEFNPEEKQRGVSLVPFLRGKTLAHPPVFFEKHMDRAPHQKGMLLWPYKVIKNLQYNQIRIYNIETDPKELVNLVDSLPQKKRNELTGVLQNWISNELQSKKPTDASKK